MKQYIDKDIIVAEIERIKKEECPIDSYEGRCKLLWFEQFLSFINTLEVKEEILDKEGKTKLMQKCVHEAFKSGYDMGVLQTTNKINHNIKDVDLEKELKCLIGNVGQCDRRLAKYFYELGLKTKGE